MTEAWGEAPGTLFVNDAGEIVLATLQAGNVVLLIQPPRGFGENPVAIYHDPDLAPSHHYLAAYRWLERGFGAARRRPPRQARLDGVAARQERRAVGRRARTDAAIGNLPLIYPFLVNDPGEGAQAKRRAHATIVDHLVPPMARAESYGDIARLEQLLDEHANIAAMDPAKLPADPRRDLAADARRRDAPRPRARRAARTTRSSTTSSCTSTAGCARSRTPRSATGCTCSARRRPARPGSTWCSRSCAPPRCGAASRPPVPGLRAALGLEGGRRGD